MIDIEFNAITDDRKEITEPDENGTFDSFSSLSREQRINILRRANSAYCPRCEKPVELLNITKCAGLFNTDEQDIRFLAKRGDLHRVHNRKGDVLVCADSLFECFQKRETRLLDSHF